MWGLISNIASLYLKRSRAIFTRGEMTHLKQAENQKDGLPNNLVAQVRLKI